jgi:integrase
LVCPVIFFLRRYVIPAIGSVKLKKLSAMHVQGMYRSMLDKDLSPRTVQYTHAVLHRALKQAVRWGLVPHNVCEDGDRLRLRREEMRPLDRVQARCLLKAAEGDCFEALYVLAIHTGMHPGELLGLK